ncbi:hypothetical protein LLEC1_02306 [Akanthomyces lecanii]|uniref:Uncharacterized protein n=1 Tax=Cordyceps confragosa TaxID=2714763 RepID=A0A179I7D7_CORDF|nr:hypothetical protein LLEC1_02306 [Akanthomyces lecanii]
MTNSSDVAHAGASRAKILVAVDFGIVLRYENGETSGRYVWGYRAQAYAERGEQIHEWFKLGLCDDFEKRRARDSELMRLYGSKTAKPPVKGQVCENLVRDFLVGIKQAVDRKLDVDPQVAALKKQYIITVPALWDYAEQEKTRACAEKANMGGDSEIMLIPESEAAGIWAIKTMLSLKKDDIFVVCDAGGGTVDLSSFQVKELSKDRRHCKLVEAGPGSGALCGSMFLNRIFEKYLEEKLQHCPSWDPEYMVDVLRTFETRIKPNFTGQAEEPHFIRIQGLKRSESHGIKKKNILELTDQELRVHVFDKVMEKIEALVRDQITHTEGSVKEIVLAGGFGRNPYLKRRLQGLPCVARQGITVWALENSHTAVVKGAVTASLAVPKRFTDEPDGAFNLMPTRTVQISSRKARRHYGTWGFAEVGPTDPLEKRQMRDDGSKVARMHWFAKMNDDIPNGQPRYYPYLKVAKVLPGQAAHEACKIDVHIFVCERRNPPEYRNDPAAWEITDFSLDLEGLPIPTVVMDGDNFYEARFEIEMILRATSLAFCGVYGRGTANERRCAAKTVDFK